MRRGNFLLSWCTNLRRKSKATPAPRHHGLRVLVGRWVVIPFHTHNTGIKGWVWENHLSLSHTMSVYNLWMRVGTEATDYKFLNVVVVGPIL